jgi:hypothetical protein
LLSGLDGAIHRDSRHHLRVREMLSRIADLPYPFVRFGPYGGDVVGERALNGSRRLGRRQPGNARVMQCIRHFAVHIELMLAGRGIADANRA